MQKQIVMIGTRQDTKGGIASVVNVYFAEGLFDRWKAIYIPTHCDGSWRRKLSIAIWAYLRVLVLLLSRQVAALHVHCASRASFWRKRAFMLPAFFFRVPVVLHIHGGGFSEFFRNECTSAEQLKVRYVFRRCAVVIALSEQWRDTLQRLEPSSKVVTVTNPVEIPPCTGNLRRGPATLLFLGLLAHRKGIYDLLNVMQRLKEDFPELRLAVGGNGEVEKVREIATDLRIARNVELKGWVTHSAKTDLLRQAWIFVLPSYLEGLPMAVLEAMAVGLPVVSTAVGGIPHAVRDGVDGFIIPPGDVDALERAIRKLLCDADLRQRMGASARERIRSTFSAEVSIPQIETIWESLGLRSLKKPAA